MNVDEYSYLPSKFDPYQYKKKTLLKKLIENDIEGT